ncbi:flagellar basal body L-ring protein FlgH [Candidatus Paracaedibacter symbiosus]|uniref:flagellar basal body L-ring protein FlgH n=1 Tax=Candidatus Paracaedibacter symbiosus TaxID=244582 RepID=UPI000509A7B5|nr:flagellar basal body L-ring protein FlgH [Candidatus Paracaedibacter symbiosus]
MKKTTLPILTMILSGCALSGCSGSLVARMTNVGDPPDMSQTQNPTLMDGYRPVSMPMPYPEPELTNVNSLWQTGSRAFFKDQRANRVGDVITVLVDLNDKSKIDSNNTYNRNASHVSNVTNFLGFESKFSAIFPKAVNPANLTNTGSNSQDTGRGLLDRKDILELKIGATIIQVLPNGNLVIQGRQEILFETELRIVEVRGIIRREDIASNNTVPYEKISEARIAYGGRGDVSDVSSVPWGQQTLNRILPW